MKMVLQETGIDTRGMNAGCSKEESVEIVSKLTEMDQMEVM